MGVCAEGAGEGHLTGRVFYETWSVDHIRCRVQHGGSLAEERAEAHSPRIGMMGEYGNRSLGVPLIVEIMSRYKIQGTFFLEPFNRELGYPGQTEPVCRYLVDHGQDVQLHVHPGHVNYGRYRSGKPFVRTDQIDDLPPQQQREMIEDGAGRIARWTGKRPVAFRAGNMGASERTLDALQTAGLWLDSSYTFPYAGGQCRFSPGDAFNGSKWYGDVLEVALSGFRQIKLPGLKSAQPLDLMGASFEECRDAVRMICDAGADAVLILHSFSLFKRRDIQYNGGKPDRVVIRRFQRFCRWLADNRKDYPARTFSEFGQMVKEQGFEPKSVPPCMLRKPFTSIVRKVVQGVNSFYWF